MQRGNIRRVRFPHGPPFMNRDIARLASVTPNADDFKVLDFVIFPIVVFVVNVEHCFILFVTASLAFRAVELDGLFAVIADPGFVVTGLDF